MRGVGFRFIRLKGKREVWTIIDCDSFDSVSKFQWCYRDGYAVREWRNRKDGTRGRINLHRVLLGLGQYDNTTRVDHANRNPLDNRLSNLRIVNASLNAQNSNKRIGRSGYRGTWKSGKKWCAVITNQYGRVYLGQFDKREDAAAAYDRKAKEIYGHHAYTNY